MVKIEGLSLFLSITAQALEPSLLGAPWLPKTAGGCRDEACCSEQCQANGHDAVNRTASGSLGCIGACMMAAEGTPHEDVEGACDEPSFVKVQEGSCNSEAADSSHACYAGALLGAGPHVEDEYGASVDPQHMQPNSFFWHMQMGPAVEGRGFTWYSRIFALFQEGHPLDMQMGMGGTWLSATGVNYDKCPCKPGGFGSNCCETKECDCAGWLFQSFEGGPGYWGNELPTTVSKWRVGDSVGCYSFYTGAPLFQFGQYNGHDCGHMGLAQISNYMLMFPDGVTFDVEGMVGVGYVHTPLGKVNATDTRNFWTITLDTENFAGPLAYFVPEFWALRQPGYEKESADFGDYSNCPALSQGGSAFEWNTLETYKASNGVFKIPKMTVPYKKGRSVLMMNNRVFNDDSQITDPIEKALASGKLDPATIMGTGTGAARQCPNKSVGNAMFGLENRTTVSVGNTTTSLEDEECVWSVKLHDLPGITATCKDEGDCAMPQYVDSKQQPIPESQAPPELQQQAFREKTSTAKYDQISDRGHTCLSQPGPSDQTLYCVQSLKGGKSSTWIGFKWYKFVDQPTLQQAKLTDTERDFMQTRIETLHKMQTRTSRWMTAKNAVEEGLAIVDLAALVNPPKGMKYGHVPVAVYEGFERPSGCETPPASPSPPPSPPRPWTRPSQAPTEAMV